MTTTLQTQSTCHTGYLGIGFSLTTVLSDYEQIVIDVPKSDQQFINGNWTRVNLGTEKFRVERIEYCIERYNDSAQVAITSLRGRGFTKANALKVRDGWVQSRDLTPEVLNQIPSHYHDLAKAEFLKGVAELTTRLTQITNNGLSLTPIN